MSFLSLEGISVKINQLFCDALRDVNAVTVTTGIQERFDLIRTILPAFRNLDLVTSKFVLDLLFDIVNLRKIYGQCFGSLST